MVQRKRLELVEVEAVAGRGRPEEDVGLREALGSVKVVVWNSRSSWRSVWPRSPYPAQERLVEVDKQAGRKLLKRGLRGQVLELTSSSTSTTASYPDPDMSMYCFPMVSQR